MQSLRRAKARTEGASGQEGRRAGRSASLEACVSVHACKVCPCVRLKEVYKQHQHALAGPW